MSNERIRSLADSLANLHYVGQVLGSADYGLSSKRRHGKPSPEEWAIGCSDEPLAGFGNQSFPVLIRNWRDSLELWEAAWQAVASVFEAARPDLLNVVDDPAEPAVKRWSARLYRHLGEMPDRPTAGGIYGSLPTSWQNSLDALATFVDDLNSVSDVARQEVEPVGDATYLGAGVVDIGGEQFTLDSREGYVLEGLLDLGATAKKDALVRVSGCDDAPTILKRIRTKHPSLAPLITLPGGKGRGGYRTKVRDGRTPK